MHKSSYLNMERFVKKYIKNDNLDVLDLGSMDIHGCYRPLFLNHNYVGADISTGPNVDYVIEDPYDWALSDSMFDIVVSGQTFEHIEFFWLTMKEMARVLRPGGLLCLIAPSSGKEHKYPVDCWRFYPDGMKALSKWANMEVIECYRQSDPNQYPYLDKQWQDCVLIATKGGK